MTIKTILGNKTAVVFLIFGAQSAVHDHHRRHGFDPRQLHRGGVHRAVADHAQSGAAGARRVGRHEFRHCDGVASRIHDFRRPDHIFPDRRTTGHRPPVGRRQGEVEAMAIPALRVITNTVRLWKVFC